MRKDKYREIHSGNGEYVSPLKELAIIELEWDLKIKINLRTESDLKLVIGRMREIQKRNQPKVTPIIWQDLKYNY